MGILLGLGGEIGDEPVVHLGRQEQPRAGKAHLRLARERLGQHAVDGLVPVDRLADDDRALAAQLQHRRLDGRRGLLEDLTAAFGAAGEDDLAHLRMLDDAPADGAPRAGDDVDGARREIRPPATISAKRRMLSGATIDGLTTMVLPQAIAAEKPRAISFSGVFQGTIWPMTPKGSRRV